MLLLTNTEFAMHGKTNNLTIRPTRIIFFATQNPNHQKNDASPGTDPR